MLRMLTYVEMFFGDDYKASTIAISYQLSRIAQSLLHLSSTQVLIFTNSKYSPYSASPSGIDLPVLRVHWPVVSVVKSYLPIKSQPTTLDEDYFLH
jgi:hypothetical protein